MNQPELSSFIWSVANLLRGDYKQSEYGRVILPFTVLRRLDCVLEPTKAAVLKEKAASERAGIPPEPFLLRKSGQDNWMGVNSRFAPRPLFLFGKDCLRSQFCSARWF